MTHFDDAARSFAAHQLPAAAHHVALALGEGPNDPRTLDLAHRILQASPDPVALTALRGNASIEQAALHALALAIAHDFTRAFDVLLRVAAQRAATPYLAWAPTWVEQHPSALLVDLAVVGRAISAFTESFDEPVDADDSRYASLDAACRWLARMVPTFTGQPAVILYYVKCLRLAKRFEEALACARQEQRRDAGFGNMLEAWTWRDMERPAEAVAAFMRAFEVKADDAILLDVGDIQLDQGAFEDASRTYARVSAQSQEYRWAQPHRLAAQFLATRDPEAYAQLGALAARGDEGAQRLRGRIVHFRDHHEPPKDLTVGLVRDLVRQLSSGNGPQTSPDKRAKMDVKVSNPESPTVSRCFELAMGILGEHVDLVITVEKIPTPDPRLPLDVALGAGRDALAETWNLWRWQGTDAAPVPPPPTAAVASTVAKLASTPLDWMQWQHQAAAMAPELAPRITELAATMVHPPRPAARDEDPVWWVYRVQLAAAVLIGRCEQAWSGSRRREVLLGLAHGAIDWPIAAVIPVLETIHHEQPEARGEIVDLFQKLHQRVPTAGYTCYRAPLYASWFRLQGVDEGARREVWRLYTRACKKPYL